MAVTSRRAKNPSLRLRAALDLLAGVHPGSAESSEHCVHFRDQMRATSSLTRPSNSVFHQKLAGDRSKSIEMIMRNIGRTVRIVPKMYVADGLNAVRTILPQCRFDEQKCAEGLRWLRLYQWGGRPACQSCW
jgi:hypothetical protein